MLYHRMKKLIQVANKYSAAFLRLHPSVIQASVKSSILTYVLKCTVVGEKNNGCATKATFDFSWNISIASATHIHLVRLRLTFVSKSKKKKRTESNSKALRLARRPGCAPPLVIAVPATQIPEENDAARLGTRTFDRRGSSVAVRQQRLATQLL